MLKKHWKKIRHRDRSNMVKISNKDFAFLSRNMQKWYNLKIALNGLPLKSYMKNWKNKHNNVLSHFENVD